MAFDRSRVTWEQIIDLAYELDAGRELPSAPRTATELANLVLRFHGQLTTGLVRTSPPGAARARRA
jgi:hypothetical protein